MQSGTIVATVLTNRTQLWTYPKINITRTKVKLEIKDMINRIYLTINDQLSINMDAVGIDNWVIIVLIW